LPQGLPDSVVRAITVAHDGSLWIATGNGLSHMVNGQFHNYTTADGLYSNRVVSVYQDRHGVIWVGTSRGINRMTGDRFAPVLSEHQIFDPRYISLAEDSSGELYALSAPKGIDHIERNQLVEVNHDLDLLSMATSPSGRSGSLERTVSSGFPQLLSDKTKLARRPLPITPGMASRWHGLDTMQHWRPQYGSNPRRQALVATVQGLARLDLQHLSFDSAKPAVFLEDVTVGRVRQFPGLNLCYLPAPITSSSFRFHFSGMARKDSLPVSDGRCRPALAGGDNSLTAVYTNIPVGTHAFRIRASNRDGMWDRAGISFPCRRDPICTRPAGSAWSSPRYAILALTAAYRLRLRQMHARQKLLEQHHNEITALNDCLMKAQEEERARIAGELHDGVLQQITSLSLMLGTFKRQPDSETKKAEIGEFQKKLIQVGTTFASYRTSFIPRCCRTMACPRLCAGIAKSSASYAAFPSRVRSTIT